MPTTIMDTMANGQYLCVEHMIIENETHANGRNIPIEQLLLYSAQRTIFSTNVNEVAYLYICMGQ